MTTWFQGLPRPHEAEALWLKEAIKWLDSLGLSNLIVQVVDNITRRLNTNSLFDIILEICKALFDNRQIMLLIC